MTLYLSRLRLNRSAGNAALKDLIDPADAARATDAHHRLLWVAFADGPERRRDFLWRADGRGLFYTLSARPPQPHDLFEPPEVKEFEPALEPGDRLEFSLRANATRAKKGVGRVDVVMDALHATPSGARADKREAIAGDEGRAWLERQGAQAGFRQLAVAAEGYSVLALPKYRGPRARQPQFGILELAGMIEITDPAAFLPKLAQGFGRAKAFGCGLMLIRRAR